MKRLPRIQPIGPYKVEIILCSQSVLQDLMDDDEGGLYHGCWMPDLETEGKIHGRIFILQDLSRALQWDSFWHEFEHALTDLKSWHKESHEGDA